MLIVKAIPPGGHFVEFLRVTMTAIDDGNAPIAVPPFEIVYTMDGTVPQVDINGNPLGSAKKRRSPIKNLPIDGPTTLKFFGRTPGTEPRPSGATSAITSFYFDVSEVVAKNEIHTADATVRNYTLAVDGGDIVRDNKGLYAIVSGDRKTDQDIREIILVENVAQGQSIGDRTLPQFGSALSRLLGQALPAGFTRGQIQTTIFQALTFLSQLQQEENVPANEQINRVISINVEAIDPTSFRYRFQVATVGGDTVSNSGIVGG